MVRCVELMLIDRERILERDISPIVKRLLLFMYTNQSLRVKWSNTLSDQFSVMNGVKQGGVLSRVHTTLSLQKVITFYDYFSKKKL